MILLISGCSNQPTNEVDLSTPDKALKALEKSINENNFNSFHKITYYYLTKEEYEGYGEEAKIWLGEYGSLPLMLTEMVRGCKEIVKVNKPVRLKFSGEWTIREKDNKPDGDIPHGDPISASAHANYEIWCGDEKELDSGWITFYKVGNQWKFWETGW